MNVDGMTLQVEEDDERRIKAAIIYVMNKLVYEKSDTYLEYNEIYNGVYGYLRLNLDNDLFNRLLSELEQEFKIVIEDDRYYLKEMYEAEEYIIIAQKTLPNSPTRKANATEKVTFKSSNKKVAKVTKNGVVKAVKKGKCKITVKTASGKKAVVKVTVK